jgi:signal transduction histidine kinase
MALILGLFLTRTLTRPLRELTAASQAMAQGDLGQRVTVRSKDELGELAAAFNQMSAELAQASQARRQMTADIAHDLRTPLTVIKGYAEALRNGDLPPTATTFETVYQEAEHLSHLIADLRTLSLADAGTLALHRQTVSPQDLLERAFVAHLPQAKQLGIELDVAVAADLPSVYIDPERLTQVLGNLVGNALRYTSDGGQITLTAQRHTDAVHLTVRDTGTGIDSADLPHIFDRFYRGDDARRTNGGESGLGLAIAKSLVEAHGGSISATSTPGEGTVFTIILPIAP